MTAVRDRERPAFARLAIAALGGGLIGFGLASVLSSAGPSSDAASASTSSQPLRRRPVEPSPPSDERGAVDAADLGASGKRGEARGASTRDDSQSEKLARSTELGALRTRERAAQRQLSEARERIAQLEREVASDGSREPKRTRHAYDLTPEDWKQMAADGVVKSRAPCAGFVPKDEVLERLGLAPDDHDTVREAIEQSANRLREGTQPLCATALAVEPAVVRNLSAEACRSVIFATASGRSESVPDSARRVASFMAGQAPRPDQNSPLTERAFLVMAEETKNFEHDLAEAFGPEDAHRIVFSEGLCFSESSFSYGAPPSRDPDL